MSKEKLFKNPIWERPHPYGEGVQKVYRFPNNYGASVIRNTMTSLPVESAIAGLAKGLFDPKGNRKYASYTDNENEWELAVVKFSSKSNKKFNLVYDTEVTEDVMGHLLEKDVEKILKKIKKLK